MSIDYSDGKAIEARILQLVSQASDLRSTTNVASNQYLDQYAEEWSFRYHLCADRGNLLRHFDFGGLDVLELGAGMGAVSRSIAERCLHLTVIEGTSARFNVLQERLRDLVNWDGHISNIQDYKSSKKFDVVCVIGVLEYSELYINPSQFGTENAHAAFIKHAKSFLKEDGVLIVAIENRLGLKYWTGCSEDHTHKLFDGILDYPATKTARTFSNRELEELFTSNGFKKVKKYYPFPDYKISKSVLTEEIVRDHPTLAAELASLAPFDSYGEPRARLMHDGLAMLSLGRAGLIQELANSFLFIGSLKDTEDSLVLKKLIHTMGPTQELAWTYSFDRSPQVKTVFFKNNPSPAHTMDLWVKKEAIDGRRPQNTDIIWQMPKNQAVLSFSTFRSLLLRELYFENSTAFFELFYKFIAWSIQRWSTGPEHLLSGEAIDALWINCCYNSADQLNPFHLFDLEWNKTTPVTTSHFIFRNVLAFSREWALFRKGSGPNCLKDFYEMTCSRFNVCSQLDEYINAETAFQ